MDVAGKRAIVFGGTSGVGLATVKRLVALGAEVVAVSRNPDKARDMPQGVRLMACDARDREALPALFRECAPFDILVNTATGGDRAMGPFLQMDMEGFQASFDKLWGYANVVRFGAEHMRETGAIVLVTGAATKRPRPGQSAISAAGGAIEAFVRAVALDIAPRRINVVSPGAIDTPLYPLETKGRDAFLEQVTARHLIPRAGTADEVAQAILFTIENDFVTATTVDVDGGWLAT